MEEKDMLNGYDKVLIRMKARRSSVLVPSLSVIVGLILFLILSGMLVQGVNPLSNVVEATSSGSFAYLKNELYYETGVASFNLDDMYNATHLYDFSSLGHFGEKVGALEFDSGYFGRALRWGSGQIVVPDLNIVDTSFTVEAWVFPTSQDSLPLAGCNVTYPYILKNGNNSMVYWWGGGSSAFYSNQAVPLNAWTHVALTYDGASGVARWYLNGSDSGSKQVGLYRDWAGKWAIGAAKPGSTFLWEGKIDEFRVFKGEARSQGKVQLDRVTPILHKLALTGLSPGSDVAQLWYTNDNPFGMLQETADASGKAVFNVYSFSDGSAFYTGVLKVVRSGNTYTSPSFDFKWEDVYSFELHPSYTETQIALIVAALTIAVPPVSLVVYRRARRVSKSA